MWLNGNTQLLELAINKTYLDRVVFRLPSRYSDRRRTELSLMNN